MKLLLTDSGVSNASILAALVDLLGRPISEARALCIPTAGYGGLYGDPDGPWNFISGQADGPMTELGWKSVGVLELTALPSIDKERWVSWVREADVLLVNGGDTLYLCHWMQESGLADVFPSLRDMVYVGLSAGSLVLTPRIGEHFASTNPRADGDDSTLGLVDFSIFPHIDSPDRTMADAEQWAAGIKGPAYVTDSQTAIKVTDGSAEVISEGYWRLFNAAVLRTRLPRPAGTALARPPPEMYRAVHGFLFRRRPFSIEHDLVLFHGDGRPGQRRVADSHVLGHPGQSRACAANPTKIAVS